MTDNRTTELLPCPFCGGEAEIVSLHPHEETPVGICCSRCPAIFADGTTYSGFKEYDTEAEAIAAWNTRAAHGTLTAEQVGEAIERNFGKLCVLDDGKPVEWREDWVCRVGIDYKAIADELNAALGGDECEMYYLGDIEDADGQEYGERECSECGFQFPYPYTHSINCCPNCMRKVKR